jgi:hypothetical protein
MAEESDAPQHGGSPGGQQDEPGMRPAACEPAACEPAACEPAACEPRGPCRPGCLARAARTASASGLQDGERKYASDRCDAASPARCAQPGPGQVAEPADEHGDHAECRRAGRAPDGKPGHQQPGEHERREPGRQLAQEHQRRCAAPFHRQPAAARPGGRRSPAVRLASLRLASLRLASLRLASLRLASLWLASLRMPLSWPHWPVRCHGRRPLGQDVSAADASGCLTVHPHRMPQLARAAQHRTMNYPDFLAL